MEDAAAERCGLSEKVFWESCARCTSERICIFSGGLMLSEQPVLSNADRFHFPPTVHFLKKHFLSIWWPRRCKTVVVVVIFFYLTKPGNGSYIQTSSSSYTRAYLGYSRPPANAAKHPPWAPLCRDTLACSRLLQTHKRFPCC